MPYSDPKKNAEYKALWHQRNKDIRRARIKSRRSSKRQYLKDIKELNSTCPGCKVEYPWYTLDFDHLPQYKKSFNLSSSGLRDKSIEEIQSEILKLVFFRLVGDNYAAQINYSNTCKQLKNT